MNKSDKSPFVQFVSGFLNNTNDILVDSAAFSRQASSARSRCARYWRSSSEDHLRKFKQNLQEKKPFK